MGDTVSYHRISIRMTCERWEASQTCTIHCCHYESLPHPPPRSTLQDFSKKNNATAPTTPTTLVVIDDSTPTGYSNAANVRYTGFVTSSNNHNGLPSSSTNTSTVVEEEEEAQVEERKTPAAAFGNPILLTATSYKGRCFDGIR